MSRLHLMQDARRERVKGKLAIAGPTGSGKTWTALRVATLLAEGGPIVFFDTEKADKRHGSAMLYADQFTFKHIRWEPPFNPQELAKDLVQASTNAAVVVVDSASHFWTKEGGTLDIAGGKFTGWKVARPAQEDLVEALQAADCHVIFCIRSKMEYVQEYNPKTQKHEVTRLGMAPVQSDDLAYEFTVMAELDADHHLHVSKSRVSSLANQSFQPHHEDRFAKMLKEWLDAGEEPTPQPTDDASNVVSIDQPRPAPGPNHPTTLAAGDLTAMAGMPATDKQRRMLHALFNGKGITDDARHDYAGQVLGRDVASISDLDRAAISQVIDALKVGDA